MISSLGFLRDDDVLASIYFSSEYYYLKIVNSQLVDDWIHIHIRLVSLLLGRLFKIYALIAVISYLYFNFDLC